MSFKKNKYVVVKKAVSKEVINFLRDYFILKKELRGLYLIKIILIIFQKIMVRLVMIKFLTHMRTMVTLHLKFF